MQLRKYFQSRPAPLRDDQTFVLTTSVAVVCFPHFFEIPLWCTLIAIVLMVYRYLSDVGQHIAGIQVPKPRRWILYILSISVTYLVYVSYGTLQGPEACTTLLVLLLCLKLNEAQKYWDAMIVLIISYFVSMCWLLFSQSLITTVYLVFATIYSTHSLMSLHAPKKLKGKLTAGFAFRDLIKAVPVFVLLFFLFPRFASPFAAMMINPSAETGFSGDLNPGEIAGLSQSNAVAFRVNFSGQHPTTKNLYWRGSVLSNYSGMNWRKSKNQYREGQSEIRNEEVISQEIILEPRFNKWIFGLDTPLRATFLTGDIRSSIRLTTDGELRTNYPLTQPTFIKVLSLPGGQTELTEGELEKNLVLYDPPSERLQKLAQSLKVSAASNLQIAERALKHFRDNGFVYSQTPGIVATVDDFLFKSKTGFCEHFAASFATLMRAAGVPARVVVGFYGGIYNEYGNYLVVRDREAHAWTEIYLKGQGWHRIDPSNSVSTDRIAYQNELARNFMTLGGNIGTLERAALFFDYINSEYTKFLINFDSTKQLEMLNELGLSVTSQKQLLIYLGILLAIVTFLISYSTSSRRIKRDRVRVEYEKVLRTLKKRGSRIKPSMGPYEVLDEGRKALSPEGSEKLKKIIEVYVEARFGGAEEATAAKNLKSLVSGF